MSKHKKGRAYTHYRSWVFNGHPSKPKSQAEAMGILAAMFRNGQRAFGWGAHIPLVCKDAEEFKVAFMIRAGNVDVAAHCGPCTHLYLPGKAFCDWLIAATSHTEYTTVVRLLERMEPGNQKQVFVLHLPTQDNYPAVAIEVAASGGLVFRGDEQPRAVFTSSNSWRPGDKGMTINLGFTYHPGDTHPEHPEMAWLQRLLCGLGTYLDCFPEALRPGIPKDMANPGWRSPCPTFTINQADEIKLPQGGTHASPCGHLREGHFKTLRSEKYTKKRYQTIFVHGCFVNGKASTVLSPEEVPQ